MVLVGDSIKKINIVKSSNDFCRIIGNNNKLINKYFIVNYEKTNEPIYKFGITISKKNANAVERNKIKRKIKNIIDNNKKICSNQLNYIIIIRKPSLIEKYSVLEKNLITLMLKIRGDYNEKK